MKKIMTGFFGMALSLSAMASNMTAPIMLPSAMVLPKGVRNFNFKGAITTPDSIFKKDGEKAGLANPMNLDITGRDIILGKDNNFDKAGVIQKLRAIGVDQDTVIAKSIGQINGTVTVSAPILAWGLTAKWTTAIVVPIKRYSLNIDTGVDQTNKEVISMLKNQLAEDGQGKEVEELLRKLEDPIRWKARDYNYQEIPMLEEQTQLGDIQLVNKYQILNTPFQRVVLSGGITLPTGKEMVVDKLVNIAGGDGQTDLSFGVNHDFMINKYLTLSTGVAYTLQFSDTVARRMPEQAKSLIGRETDSEISRDLGDIMGANVATTFNYRGAAVGVGYSFQHKGKDSYEGNSFEAQRYTWLAKDSEQNMHSVLTKIGYDTITLYKEGKFVAPLGISLTHTRILAGKNVVKNPLTTLDISMFF